MKRGRALWLLVAVSLALTVVRLWLAGHIELLPEEAYYWTYAKHPAFGYFDHPPMVAWIIRAGTWLLGDTERGVRLVNTLLWACTCVTLFRTGRIWFGERVAIWAAWLFVLLPIFVGVGFIVTPDGALVFAWMLTLYAISRALQTERTGFWMVAGIAFGAALLSKYYALLLAPSLLLFLLRSKKYRFWLGRWQPWAALALGLAVFSPVIVWNAQHDWASFAFQSTRTVAQRGHLLPKLGEFWLMQLAVLTPIGLAVFAIALVRGIRRGAEDAWNFSVAFSLPLFALFVAASFKTGVHINWTAPAFLSLSFAAAAVFLDGLDGPRRRVWLAGVWSLFVLSATLAVLGHVILATGKPKLLAYSRAGGWRDLAAKVEQVRQALAAETGQEPFIIGADKYNIAAELGFYLQRPDDCVNMLAVGGEGLSYRYWTDLRRFDGRPAIAVILSQRDRMLGELEPRFDRVEVPTTAPVGTHAKKTKMLSLVKCYKYRFERRRVPGGESP